MLHGAALRAELLALPRAQRDAFVDELLGIDDAVPDDGPLPSGAVPYLPVGVDVILEVARAAPVTRDSVVVDLGCGLGRVPLLLRLLTGCRAWGIELQPHLVEAARKLGAEVVEGDAGEVAAEADVYFCYASFSVTVLRRCLRRIEQQQKAVFCAADFDVFEPGWIPRPTKIPSLTCYDWRRPA